MVLDGPVDATSYLNRPWEDLAAQSAGLETALGRFLSACAADQTACDHFGGADPRAAYDRLVAQATAHPIPAPGDRADPRPVDGDDINYATAGELYSKSLWSELANALAAAANGDGTLIRLLSDTSYGRRPHGGYDPSLDRYFTITATEQRYPSSPAFFFKLGADEFGAFPHMHWNSGYDELNYGLWRKRDGDAFRGPFRIRRSARTALVVATTFDPATPYGGALRLVHDLRKARLITMDGDGHTAYGGQSRCIDSAVNAYLNRLKLPPAGTRCRQATAFAARAGAAVSAAERRRIAGRL
jgi:hypothetical protein